MQNEDDGYKCVCAFDLDDTLTCGLERAAAAIAACRENNCKIAINTARPSPWFSDIKLQELGLKEDDFIDDFYHGEPFQCSFQNRECLEKSISGTKIKHLQTLALKWNVEPRRVILFDDQYPNVLGATKSGFSSIHANHYKCGLPEGSYNKVHSILNN